MRESNAERVRIHLHSAKNPSELIDPSLLMLRECRTVGFEEATVSHFILSALNLTLQQY